MRIAAAVIVALGLVVLAAAIYFRPQPRSDFQRQVRWCHETLKSNGINPTNGKVGGCVGALNGSNPNR